MRLLLIVLLPALIFTSCGQNKSDSENTKDSIEAGNVKKLQAVKAAFVYTLPLVIMDLTMRQSLNPDPSNAMYAPVNTFKHLSSFPDVNFRNVVRPNADTYYSLAVLDLTAEPMVLSVPNTHGRYYMMPMLDAYTNVFASPGTRTTGNEAGTFLICGPQWMGTVPEGMKQIQAPTSRVWIIGRTQVNSKEDGLKVVTPLQKQYKLSPLSAWGKPYAPAQTAANSIVPKENPNVIVENMSVDEYFNYANELLLKYPPPAVDSAVLKRFALIGVGAGLKFSLNSFTEDIRTGVEACPREVFSMFDLQQKSKMNLENGWSITRNSIGTYGTDYNSRAFISYFGLGANIPEDAIYPTAMVDGNKETLNGTHKYILHFEKGQTPPADAFWSLTMYDTSGFFVPNTINRYVIGDRSNLKFNLDGSLDIYIQHDAPLKNKISNWLPAPQAEFNLAMRVYKPKEEMINGTWKIPAIRKIID